MNRAVLLARRWLAPLALAAAVCVPPCAAQDPAATPAPEGPKALDLSLEDALRIALEHDMSLKQEEIQIDVARFNYAGSWGAFDPIWTANASVTDTELEPQTVFSQTSENTQAFDTGIAFPLTTGGRLAFNFETVNTETDSTFQLLDISTTDLLTVSYTQPLLRGAWRAYATSRQREDELRWEIRREVYRQTRQQVLLNVENSYWDLVAAIEELAVADVTLDLGRQQLDQNRRRLDAGVGTEVDVLQAEANVAVRIEQRAARENALRRAADALKAAIFGASTPERWDIDVRPITPLPEEVVANAPPWEAALAVAREARPELRQRRLEVEISDQGLLRASSERRPQLDFVVSSTARGFDSQSDAAFDSAIGWEYPSSRAELRFSFPLGNRTARNNLRAARALLRSAYLAIDQTDLQIATEVRAAVRELEYSAEAVRASAASLGLARRQLEAEEARYREGLSTTFQVLEFQQQLAEALSAHKRARTAFVKSRAALARAQGLLGERIEPDEREP